MKRTCALRVHSDLGYFSLSQLKSCQCVTLAQTLRLERDGRHLRKQAPWGLG